MYTEKLKESMGGIIGSFIIENRELKETDLKEDLQFATQNIYYIMESVTEYKNFRMLLIVGNKKSLFVHIRESTIVGVILKRTANTSLLDLVVRKVLEIPAEGASELEPHPATIEEQVPYFDDSKEEVLPNVPEYARKVLKFVDGNRTIGDIIDLSNLPPEVVLDVILAYRRSSVLHYR
ncbi:MAG: hypothetical protein PVF58_13680 [Candidatus Methanofastidiosia archaeon]|jgi:hypothetical protein